MFPLNGVKTAKSEATLSKVKEGRTDGSRARSAKRETSEKAINGSGI